jgi:hypothetical protein
LHGANLTSTPLLDLLAVYSRRVGNAELQLLHAATESASYEKLAQLLGRQQELVDEAARLVRHIPLSNAREQNAHADLILCFESLAHGLGQLKSGYEAEGAALAEKAIATASRQFERAKHSLHTAKLAGHRARQLLGCDHTCRILA